MTTMKHLALLTLGIIALVITGAAIALSDMPTASAPRASDTVHAIVTDKWQLVLYLFEVQTDDGRTDTLVVSPSEWGRIETYGDVVHTRDRP